MEKTKIVKDVLKAITSIGLSAILGGIGGIATAQCTGIAKTIAKVTVPVTNLVLSKTIRKQTDPVAEEMVDDAAKMIGIVDNAATVAKAVVEEA